MKPVIGIPKYNGLANYKNAIKKHGGKVELLDDSKQTVVKIHGLLLPGGRDIYPCYYGDKKHDKTYCYNDKKRDEFEMSLFKEGIKKDIPVFGICRGIQIMNVAMEGSLHQHITEHRVDLCEDITRYRVDGKDIRHEILIEPNSILSSIVDKNKDKVNSAHHQAIKGIGKELVVTARSEDDIIEAMEYPSKKFVIGVQYHPERMWIDQHRPELGLREHAKKLFEAFINAAST